MRAGDTLKAVGLAALILALNLLVTTVVISAYTIANGTAPDVVSEMAIRIASWSAPIVGGVLFLAAIAWLGRRRPGRNPYSFAVRAWVAYVILDVASGAAMGPLSAMLTWVMAVSMTLSLTGAMAGAALARPRTLPVESTS